MISIEVFVLSRQIEVIYYLLLKMTSIPNIQNKM